MRISQNALDCVAFLGSAAVDGSGFDPFATAFLYRPLGRYTLYLVTAKHCVHDGDPFWVRHNTPKGADTMLIEEPDWAYHDDLSVDIAVLEFPESPEDDWRTRQGWRGFPAVHGERTDNYGPGDIIYTVGLFRHHSGTSRNLPLVHTGHIAAFSEGEKIEVLDWDRPGVPGAYKSIDAYVIQCSVMPGGSGSPVFVRQPKAVAPQGGSQRPGGPFIPQPEEQRLKGYGELHLLGVWHASWDLPPEKSGTITRNPAGYGIVIPARKILEIIDMPKLKERDEMRKQEALAKRNLPVADSLPKRESQERFDTTLRQMLETPPDPRVAKGEKKTGD